MQSVLRYVALATLFVGLLTPTYAVAAPALARLSVLRTSHNGRLLEVKRESDVEIQRLDVMAKCGQPFVGEGRIRLIQDQGQTVQVTFGKHCSAEVLIRDLAIRCNGCD